MSSLMNVSSPLLQGMKWERVLGYAETRPSKSMVAYPKNREDLLQVLDYAERNILTVGAKGSGYTYGDMIQNDRHIMLDLSLMNEIKSWDSSSGKIVVEPGVTFAQIFYQCLPQNWTLSSCPGGLHVTIGGAIANNVHGKDSWSQGNFGTQVESMKLLTSGGELMNISAEEHPELFEATIGGMGLTGIILEATLKLRAIPSPFVRSISTVSRDCDEMVDLLEAAKDDADFSVAWVDTFPRGPSMGRGFVTKAHWLETDKKLDLEAFKQSLVIPSRIFGILPSEPTWFMARPFFGPKGIRLANWANFHRSRMSSPRGVSKPVDQMFTSYNFMHNRIPNIKHVYRPHGFLEFQPLIPKSAGKSAVRDLFLLCQKLGYESLLCGVKMHQEDSYPLSYSGEGYSIGVDVQLRGRPIHEVEAFATEIFNFTESHGGKVYLAKDEMLDKRTFRRMYPRVDDFMVLKRAIDPKGLLASDLYRRLFL